MFSMYNSYRLVVLTISNAHICAMSSCRSRRPSFYVSCVSVWLFTAHSSSLLSACASSVRLSQHVYVCTACLYIPSWFPHVRYTDHLSLPPLILVLDSPFISKSVSMSVSMTVSKSLTHSHYHSLTSLHLCVTRRTFCKAHSYVFARVRTLQKRKNCLLPQGLKTVLSYRHYSAWVLSSSWSTYDTVQNREYGIFER